MRQKYGRHRGRNAADTAEEMREIPRKKCGRHRGRNAADTAAEMRRYRGRNAADTVAEMRQIPRQIFRKRSETGACDRKYENAETAQKHEIQDTGEAADGRIQRMIANYHTHTWRCKHASGTEREYVENAIAGGLKILGFSDHTPMPYPDGYVSNTKMDMDQLEDYMDVVLALRKEYEKEIEIHVGLEVEYYPAYFDELIRFAGQFPIEYFILGQHCLGNEIGDVASFEATGDPVRLQRYCDQTTEALETGRFTYFAHPDVIHFVGDGAVYEQKMRRLCERVKELDDIPLEINFLGIWEHRYYPNDAFWKIVGEVGNRVIFGADAHQPGKVWNPEAIKVAEEMVRTYHLNLIETVDFVKPV